jgi:hypothetical protein
MAEVDVGAETYPSFGTLDFADMFLGGDVMRATAWALRNEDARGRGMASATRLMMQLPWVEAPSIDDAPVVVQEVQAMLAADLLAKPRLFADASGSSNVKSAKAGSAQVEFFRPIEGGPPIPMALWNMLLNAQLVRLPGDGESINAGAMVSGICGGARPLGGRCWWEHELAAGDRD